MKYLKKELKSLKKNELLKACELLIDRNLRLESEIKESQTLVGKILENVNEVYEHDIKSNKLH